MGGTVSSRQLANNSLNSVISFIRFARANGLNVGLGEAKDTLRASESGVMSDPELFKHTLKSICCGTYNDIDLFEEIYGMYWFGEGDGKHSVRIKNENRQKKSSQSSLILEGNKMDRSKSGDETSAKNMSGADYMEKLRKTDFSNFDNVDEDHFDSLAEELWRQMSLRMKRRMKAGTKSGRIDFGRTIRRSISKGGWPTELVNRQRKLTKKRLVVLLDVSGSMDKYSFYLLKFIFALKQYFETIEAFVFSTELNHITPHLKNNNIEKAQSLISEQVTSWSSGTRIGGCLEEFNTSYAKSVLSRSAIVIILSDGLDTGDPEILEKAIRDIKLKTKQLIWLNPLKGMEGYEPIQRGMSSALPLVDEFQSAHNLDSLLDLENYLSYV